MRTVRYSLCDVFTDRALAGNALAVFTGVGDLPDATLQAIAREMNLSETVFVYPPSAGGSARIRIFTPRVELPFAGHPVLGSAAVIGRSVQTNPVWLETGAGNIRVDVDRQGADVRGARMRPPVPEVSAWPEPGSLLEALGLTQVDLPIELYDLGPRHLVVAAPDVEMVRALKPDFGALEALHPGGFAVYARDGEGLEARVFAPGAGVNEDAATGSAAGPIVLHACRHHGLTFGETYEIAQGAALERPSKLYASAEGNEERCTGLEVGGGVVIIGRGELRLP